MSLGPLTFLAPLTLLGLLVLPLVWLILRISPPAPRRQVFPALSILRGVETDEETPNATPWWLLLYRLLMVAIAVIALSLPLLSRNADDGVRPLTLIVDDSALSAPVWDALMDDARRRVREAQRQNLDVVLISGAQPSSDAVPAAEALQRLRGLRPRSVVTPVAIPDLPPDRETVFLLSGLTMAQTDVATQSLRDAGATVILAEPAPSLLVPGDVRETSDGFESDWFALSGGRTASLEALAANGEVLAVAPLAFAPGRTLATASVALPPQLRTRVTRLRIAGSRASASTKLLDDTFGRPLVGVLAPPSGTSSPLLSEDFYAQQALAPFADVFIGDQSSVLSVNPTVLVMPDIMGADDDDLRGYVDGGGVLIRFAGPRLAKSQDSLVPVELREGGRSIGGALAWETPQRLAAFSAESPFAGLAIPDDVTVSRQVMARPGAETDARTWARLEDGSPVVTSSTQGDGRIILFHVTAGPEWSNLAISGLYVEMLKRILPLAKSRAVSPQAATGQWVLDRQLEPFGELRPPPPQPITLPQSQLDAPARDTLPGYYRLGTQRRAINLIAEPTQLQRFQTQGMNVERISGGEAQSLAGWLLGLALAMLAIDMILSAWLSGRMRRFLPGNAVTASVVLACLLSTQPSPGFAQDSRLEEAALGLHLAYVETGDARVDALSRAALESLSTQLTLRTTIEPVGVHGVTLDDPGLEMYPFLYWPIRMDTPALSDDARVGANRYIAAGGTFVLDTADEAERSLRAGSPHPGLARVTEGLNIGRLVRVPQDHVLTKSFYLMQVFPGRWANGPVFVEAEGATATGRDGVSSVIIGSHDWAAGWAIDETIGAMVDLSNDIPRQREMSIRFGVNLAMYALSGNYKADQVHAAELVRRLGEGQP